jgi:hypothetical protein
MTNTKQRFYAIVESNIKRDGFSDLLKWLEDSDFFTAPASTRFHGNYEGGLLEHSVNTYDCLHKNIESRGTQTEYSEETMAITALLHDVCKVNFYVKGFRNVKENDQWVKKEVWEIDEKFPCGDHADKSVIILQNFIKLLPDEILAIRAHMGGWDNAAKGGCRFVGSIFERCRLAVLLHMADMEATYLLEQREWTNSV